MLLIGRFGEFVSSESSRVKVTALAGVASAFFEMNSRPVVVEAHKVELSAEVRLTQLMAPPLRAPREDGVSVAPSRSSQSPHGAVKSPVNSLQCWSTYACG